MHKRVSHQHSKEVVEQGLKGVRKDMACCKEFEETKARKGRKQFPTKSPERLGKDTRVRHRGVAVPVCSSHHFET